MTENEREQAIWGKYKNADPQCEGAFLLRLLDEVLMINDGLEKVNNKHLRQVAKRLKDNHPSNETTNP